MPDTEDHQDNNAPLQIETKIAGSVTGSTVIAAGGDVIIYEGPKPAPDGDVLDACRAAIVLCYRSTTGELFAASLSVNVHRMVTGNGRLIYVCPSHWQKLRRVVWESVNTALRKKGMRELSRLVQPSQEQSSLQCLLSECRDYEIEVRVEPSDPGTTVCSEHSLSLSTALAILAALNGFDLDHEVAVCTGLFPSPEAEFSDAASVRFQDLVKRFSIAYALCDPDIRNCPQTNNYEIVWVSVANIDDIREFLLWKQYMPVFRHYLTEKSSEKRWREAAKLYTALEVRGGDVPIRMLPWGPNRSFLESEPIDLGRVIEENRHVVILGDPGTGKSHALLVQTHRLICQSLGKAIELPDSEARTRPPVRISKFPVYVNMRDFAGSADFVEFITGRLPRYMDLSGKELDHLLRTGCLLFLVDSINELRGDVYDEVMSQIRDFKERYGDNRFVFASRTHNYSPLALDVSSIYWIQPLDEDRQRKLLVNYLKEVLEIDRIEWLCNQMQISPSLRSLAVNPHNLALIAYRYERARTVPKDRRDLLNDFLVLRYEWGGSLFAKAELIINALSGLALHMIDNLNGATSIGKEDAVSVLDGELERVSSWGLPERVRERAETRGVRPVEILFEELLDKDLLRQKEQFEEGNRVVLVSFPHQTYQEFLAGSRFVELHRDRIPETLRKRLVSMSWDEAAILLVPYIGPEDMRKILVALAQIDMALAIQCFLKAREEYIDPSTENALIEELVVIAQSRNEVSAKRRTALDALAQMKSDDASKKLVKLATSLENELQAIAAKVAAQHRPPNSMKIALAACENTTSENLGNAVVCVLKLNLSQGVKALVKRVAASDSSAVQPILDHLLSQKSVFAQEGADSREFSTWLSNVITGASSSVSVKAASLSKRLYSEKACSVPIHKLKRELNSYEEDRREWAIKTARDVNLCESVLDLIDSLSLVSHTSDTISESKAYEVRKLTLEALSSLARVHEPGVTLESIWNLGEAEACLTIIASTQHHQVGSKKSTSPLSDLEKIKSIEEVINILILDSDRQGWAAASALALMGNLPIEFERHLLSLAKDCDKSVAARSILALSWSDSREVISKLFEILSEVEVEPLADFVKIPTEQAIFIRELVCAVLHQLKKQPDEVQSAVKDIVLRQTLTNLRRLSYACFLDNNNIFPLVRVTAAVLNLVHIKYADVEGPHLSELFHSESEFDRHAAIFSMSGISIHRRGLKYYRRAFPPDELAPYLESPKSFIDLLAAIRIAKELRYKELLPRLNTWLDAEISALPLGGLRSSPIGSAGKEIIVSWICEAIGLINPKDKEQRESIFLSLGEIWKDASGAIKNDIAKTLETIGPDKNALKIYETMFSKSTPGTVRTIATLLGEVGSEETAIYLNKLASDTSQPTYIRNAAWEALQTIQTRLRVRIDLEGTE